MLVVGRVYGPAGGGEAPAVAGGSRLGVCARGVASITAGGGMVYAVGDLRGGGREPVVACAGMRPRRLRGRVLVVGRHAHAHAHAHGVLFGLEPPSQGLVVGEAVAGVLAGRRGVRAAGPRGEDGFRGGVPLGDGCVGVDVEPCKSIQCQLISPLSFLLFSFLSLVSCLALLYARQGGKSVLEGRGGRGVVEENVPGLVLVVPADRPARGDLGRGAVVGLLVHGGDRSRILQHDVSLLHEERIDKNGILGAIVLRSSSGREQ